MRSFRTISSPQSRLLYYDRTSERSEQGFRFGVRPLPRQLLPATCRKHKCRVRQGCRERPLLSAAVPDAALPPPSLGSYLLHPCSRQSLRQVCNRAILARSPCLGNCSRRCSTSCIHAVVSPSGKAAQNTPRHPENQSAQTSAQCPRRTLLRQWAHIAAMSDVAMGAMPTSPNGRHRP